MKIYLNQGEIGDLKEIVRRRGQFLTILRGINISQINGNLEITPIYASLAQWNSSPHQLTVIIGWKFPLLLAVLQKRWPFIQVMILGEDQDEI